MSSSSVSSQDETMEMKPLGSNRAATAAALEETVKLTAQTAQAESIGEMEATVRVQVNPFVETQPTMPASGVGASSQPETGRRSVGIGQLPVSGWVMIAVAGVGVLLILAGVGLSLSAGRDWFAVGTATPTATLTPSPTQTLAASPTRPPTNTPVLPTSTPVLPTATARPAPTALAAGVLAQVTPPQGLKLKVRSQAGTDGQVLGELENGAQVKLVEGPLEANNLKWWKVDNGQGLVGWSAEGSGSDTYLVPVGWAQ